MIGNALRSIQNGLWVAIFLLLPVSSMPFVVRLVGSDTVAAPSGLFMLLFVIVWFVPYLLKGGQMPWTGRLFLAFAVMAVFSTLLSFFYDIPLYKGISPSRNAINALLTLVVGVSFYLAVATWVDDSKKIAATLQLINWAGLAIVLWSLLQAFYWARDNRYPEWMRTIHDLYSVGPLFRQRVSGFSLEPSWLAHQLNMLYLPYWLAATVGNFSAHRARLYKLTFENILLVAGALVLWLTLSRVGLLGFLGMLAFLLIWFNVRFLARLRDWIMMRFADSTSRSRLRSRLITVALSLVLLFGYALVVFGVGFGLSRVDQRMTSLFQFDPSRPDAFLYYAEKLTFASRVVYWQAGWSVFDRHPLLGVGLGNSGYFFPEALPPYAWKLVEVRDLVYRSSVLLNIKSLWVRLLAETGIVGFSLFIGLLYLITRQAVISWRANDRLLSTLGLMGLFVMIALIFEGFSIDSFGLPYIWTAMGLSTSSAWIVLKSHLN